MKYRVTPSRACDWCGRVTRYYRHTQDGGYECRLQERCLAKRRGRLVAMGTSAVLAAWERHACNLSKTADALDVTATTIRRFLGRYAPERLAQARREGRLRRGYQVRPLVFADRETLLSTLRRYDFVIGHAAKALKHDRGTVLIALKQLAPDVYEWLLEQRRQRAVLAERRRQHKQNPARHPWRQDGSLRSAA